MELKLIGRIQYNPAPKDYSLISEMFARLPKDIINIGETARFIRYEVQNCKDTAVFFGIEVETLELFPDDLVAWVITETRWIIKQNCNNTVETVWSAETRNQWSTKSPNGKYSIEFSTQSPPEWFGESAMVEMRMTANAYIKHNETNNNDDIELAPFSSMWQSRFEETKQWIQTHFDNIAPRIEHYGSTALPNMSAKPIIDVLVETPDINLARRRALDIINDPAWELWHYGSHVVLIKRAGLMGKRTHHIHIAEKNDAIWEGIRFRDYLLAHPETAMEYAKLKQKLMEMHRHDREAYTSAKTAFILDVLSRGK